VTQPNSFGDRVESARELLRSFYVQRIRGFEPPLQPHLDPFTEKWLADRLERTKLFLEFGSGGSTLLANRLGVRTITVESDRFYAAVVEAALDDPKLATLIVPKMGVTTQWGMPLIFKRRKGARYVSAPFKLFENYYPDLIMVDGRYRVACVLETARLAHLRGTPAKLLLDDYEDRPFYHVLEEHLGTPVRIGRAAVFDVGRSGIQEEAVRLFATDPR
jgi:hypothetical protein